MEKVNELYKEGLVLSFNLLKENFLKGKEMNWTEISSFCSKKIFGKSKFGAGILVAVIQELEMIYLHPEEYNSLELNNYEKIFRTVYDVFEMIPENLTKKYINTVVKHLNSNIFNNCFGGNISEAVVKGLYRLYKNQNKDNKEEFLILYRKFQSCSFS